MGSYMTLEVPSIVGMPSNGASGLRFRSDQSLSENTVVMSYNSAQRLITFAGIVPTESAFVQAPGPIQFSVSGFTNP
jgi:hypothetical protein